MQCLYSITFPIQMVSELEHHVKFLQNSSTFYVRKHTKSQLQRRRSKPTQRGSARTFLDVLKWIKHGNSQAMAPCRHIRDNCRWGSTSHLIKILSPLTPRELAVLIKGIVKPRGLISRTCRWARRRIHSLFVCGLHGATKTTTRRRDVY